MREAQNVRSAVYENQPYRTDESKQFISPRTRCTDIEILLIYEALCARRTRVTSAVERVDFSQSSALSKIFCHLSFICHLFIRHKGYRREKKMKKVLLFTISWRGSPKEASRLIENGLPHINK